MSRSIRRWLTAAVASAALAAPAAGASAAESAWPLLATEKVFPTSVAPAGVPAALSISAGRDDFEGGILALRSDGGATVPATVSDLVGPATIPASAVRRFRVGYVSVAKASTGVDSLAGSRYPDPLIPLDGALVVPAGETTGLYLLVKVPADAPPGRYSGSVDLGPLGTRAIELDVAPVDVSRDAYQVVARLEPLSLAAAFGVAERDPALVAGVNGSLLPMLREHGVSPSQIPYSTPKIDPATWATDFSNKPWSATSDNIDRALGLGFPRIEIPFLPSYGEIEDRFYLQDARRRTYARGLAERYAGAIERVFAIPVDEPTQLEYPTVVRAAAQLHAASPAIDVVVTEAPSLLAQTLMGAAVDVWAPPIWSFYQHRSAMETVRARGKGVWWYTYGSDTQRFTPNLLIDKPTTDARVSGWLAAREGVQGMFYWSLNAWRVGKDKVFQDPWTTPWRVSHVSAPDLCFPGGREVGGNGEASLIYPGRSLREPAFGSLRLEALRDGIEDNSVLQTLRQRDPGYFEKIAQGVARPYSGEHTGFKLCSPTNRPPYLPVVTEDPADLAAARIGVLRRLGGAPLVTMSGRVMLDGKPVAGATVRFGIFTTVTAADGTWTLTDMPPVPGKLVVSRDPEGLVDRVETAVTSEALEAAAASGDSLAVKTPPLPERPSRPVFSSASEMALFAGRRRPAAARTDGRSVEMTIARRYTAQGRELPGELRKPPEVEAWYPKGRISKADRDWRGWRWLEFDVDLLAGSAPDQPWRMVVTPGNWRSARYLVIGQRRQHLRLDLRGLPLQDVRYLRFGLESALPTVKRGNHRIQVRLRVSGITLTK